MRRAISIKSELDEIATVQDLTEVFESIASMKISKIRDRVISSKEFFADLWGTYQQLRIDPKEQLVRNKKKKRSHAFVAVTSEGKLSGGVTEQVVAEISNAIGQVGEKVDIVAIGSQGESLLAPMHGDMAGVFPLPDTDDDFTVDGVMDVLRKYEKITVFYQTYESLRVQKIANIELVSAIRELGSEVKNDADTANSEDIVSSKTYTFEPSISEIADYLEVLMMEVALTQVLMEAKLAQYASRFNAMNAAKHRALDMHKDFNLMYHRAKRSEGDERLKETMKVLMRKAA